jgi:hypothetical protein
MTRRFAQKKTAPLVSPALFLTARQIRFGLRSVDLRAGLE